MKSINFSSIVLAGALFASASAQAASPYPLWMSHDDNSVVVRDSGNRTSSYAPVSTYAPVSDDDTTTTTTTTTSSDDDFWLRFTQQTPTVTSYDQIGQGGHAGRNGAASNVSSAPVTGVYGGPVNVAAGTESSTVYGHQISNINLNPTNNALIGGDSYNLTQAIRMAAGDMDSPRGIFNSEIARTAADVYAPVTSGASANQRQDGDVSNSVYDPVDISF